jgi:hypothetical protein
MSQSHEAKAKKCPMTAVLALANRTARTELGAVATSKRVSVTATLTTAVTENSKKKTTAVDATVSLGAHVTEEDAPEGCGCAH